MISNSRSSTFGLFMALLFVLTVFPLAAHDAEAKISRPVRLHYGIYKTALENGMFPDALLNLETIRSFYLETGPRYRDKHFPVPIEFYRQLLEACELCGRPEQEIQFCTEALENIGKICTPEGIAAGERLLLTNRAWALILLERPDDALAELDRMKKNQLVAPKAGLFSDPEAQLIAAAALTQKRLYEDASKKLEELARFVSISIDPKLFSRTFAWRARVNLLRGDFTAALADAGKAGDIPGSDPVAKLERARALAVKAQIQNKLNRFNLAAKAAQDALKESNYVPEAYVELARAQIAMSNMLEAQATIASADKIFYLNNCPHLDEIKVLIATALAQKQNPQSTGNQTTPITAGGNPETPQSAPGPAESSIPPATSLGQDMKFRDKWALVIGISKFNDPSLDLKYAAKDARDFSEYLMREANFPLDHVRVLTDGDATRERILEHLADNWLPRMAKPGDLVVLFISTHASPDTKQTSGLNYLFTSDTRPSLVQATGIALQDLIRILKTRIHTDKVVIILDACHSGGAQSQGLSGAGKSDALLLSSGSGATVLASSRDEERSWELLNKENSAFTHYLIEGLRQSGTKTTLKQAFEYLRERVIENVLNDRGVMQTPLLEASNGGEHYVLASPQGKGPASPYSGSGNESPNRR